MRRVPAIVVGAGVMGAASAWSLARRGREVVLLDRFGPGHTRGSSHGGSRIFRLAYPDRFWIDLARRARADWRALETECGTELIAGTGSVDHGAPAGVNAIHDALASAGVPVELLTPPAAHERWPGLRFDGDVCFQPDGGRIDAAGAWTAFVTGAEGHDAEVHWDTAVHALEPAAGRARVVTDAETYDADVAVVAAGGWAEPLLGRLVALPPLRVTQESVFHFAPRLDGPWPSFIHHGEVFRYGLETPGEGIKVAEHHTGPSVTADERDGVVDAATRARVREFVSDWIPGVDPQPVTETTCLYTSTPDENFVVDRRGPVVVASPCSGHGFKFAPLVGRLVADLVDGDGGEPRFRAPAR